MCNVRAEDWKTPEQMREADVVYTALNHAEMGVRALRDAMEDASCLAPGTDLDVAIGWLSHAAESLRRMRLGEPVDVGEHYQGHKER